MISPNGRSAAAALTQSPIVPRAAACPGSAPGHVPAPGRPGPDRG
jgi:hypothetical protein